MQEIVPNTFEHYKSWLEPHVADSYFTNILKETDDAPTFYVGPRKFQQFGDEGTNFSYMGQKAIISPWTKTLSLLKLKVETELMKRFNTVFINRYEDETKNIPRHSDLSYIPQLEDEPTIPLISLGDTRDFILYSKDGEKIVVPMHHGDMIVMKGRSQLDWQHELPRAETSKNLRISVTFRQYTST